MRLRAAAIAAVLVILVAACGGNDDDQEVTRETTSTTTTSTTTTTVPAISPLTGLPADQEVRTRPVVAIKIDNVDGKATPQLGINEADVVYEIQVEGSVTRLLSLFQSTDVGPVGPVRSARGSEIALLEALNKPLFTWHGANAILGPQVKAAKIQARSIDEIGGVFYREPSRPAPYNSFVRGTPEIRATADEGSSGPTEPIFTFADEGEEPSPLAEPASAVDIRFTGGPGGAPVHYNWDDGLWRRSQAGHPHVDADGDQVAVENVIVRFVSAADSGTRDSAGNFVPTAQVVGEGEAWVFSQGTVTTGRWVKPDNTSPTEYLDDDGDPIKLTPGNTWISMPYTAAASSFR